MLDEQNISIDILVEKLEKLTVQAISTVNVTRTLSFDIFICQNVLWDSDQTELMSCLVQIVVDFAND